MRKGFVVALTRCVGRFACLMFIASLSACGGGGSGASPTSEIPVRMTLTATPINAGAVDVRWSGLSAAPTKYELYVNGGFWGNVFPASVSSGSESVTPARPSSARAPASSS